MNLSFNMTVEAVKDGVKTETRRVMNKRNYQRWENAFLKGTINTAYDKSPQYGGKRIAQFVLTAKPKIQRICDMTEAELVAEGVPCKTPEEFAKFTRFGLDEIVMVLEFTTKVPVQ